MLLLGSTNDDRAYGQNAQSAQMPKTWAQEPVLISDDATNITRFPDTEDGKNANQTPELRREKYDEPAPQKANASVVQEVVTEVMDKNSSAKIPLIAKICMCMYMALTLVSFLHAASGLKKENVKMNERLCRMLFCILMLGITGVLVDTIWL